jgi:TonB family protein
MDISNTKAATEKPSYSGTEKGNPASSFGEKDNRGGSITGDKNVKDATSSTGLGRDNITEPSGSTNVGKAAANYTIQWKDGGSRSKISGSLPKLESLSKQVQIKLKIVVKPDGTITQITPLQKGDYKLENAAIQAIKNWKFEPLRSDLSQIDQSGIVTFLFKLE